LHNDDKNKLFYHQEDGYKNLHTSYWNDNKYKPHLNRDEKEIKGIQKNDNNNGFVLTKTAAATTDHVLFKLDIIWMIIIITMFFFFELDKVLPKYEM